jgi:hypothetical protein
MVPVLLSAVIVAPTASVAAAGGDPKPAALCQFVASAQDADDRAAVEFAPSQADVSLTALRKAAKDDLPGELKQAVKRLVPLYQTLARNGTAAAFSTLDRYATQHCRSKNLADINPCGLVSLDEAEALAGTPLGSPVGEYAEACNYSGTPGGPTATVEIYVGPGAKSILDIDNREGQLPPVPDLGDEAYIKDGALIYFQQSGIWVVIRVLRLDDVDRSQALRELARAVIAKIDG